MACLKRSVRRLLNSLINLLRNAVFLKEMDFAEAVDCFSRALEIRLAHYGELAAKCVNAYCKYGSSLLEKAQAEADPLGNMPKKDSETQQESSDKNTGNVESLIASVVSSDAERQGSLSGGQEGSAGQEQGENGEESKTMTYSYW